MFRKLSMLGLAIGLAVIGLALFVSLVAVADSVGTAFTYQGYLEDGGSAADGTYDFKFRLYDAASDGSQVGSEVVKDDETVSDGLFTVELDFGSDAFTGDARWLEVDVKADAEGSYTTISPRTALTPAPYALALPGLWTQQNATSPNVIGGHSDNTVTSGVVGATIGGGGTSSVNANSVTDDYGTVGGGYRNQAGDDAGTTSDAPSATVGGGYLNAASGEDATVGGGYFNRASGNYATVGGGKSNEASSTRATVGGGESNTASGNYATVGGGKSNEASYTGTVGGGESNTASGSQASTVGGGKSNTASDYYATVPGGYQAEASLYGQMAYASGQFAAVGDAQASLYVLRNATSDATETELYLDGSSRRLTVASGRTMIFYILVAARSDGGDSAVFRREGVIENDGGITSLTIFSQSGWDQDSTGWTIAVEGDDTYDALVIKVTGSDDNIRWVAAVHTAEVAY